MTTSNRFEVLGEVALEVEPRDKVVERVPGVFSEVNQLEIEEKQIGGIDVVMPAQVMAIAGVRPRSSGRRVRVK